MRVAVLGGRSLVAGLRLAGVDAQLMAPGPEAEARFDELAAAEDLAVIILDQRLYAHLRSRVAALRASPRPLPSVLVLPDRGEDARAETTARLLEDFLGLKV